MGVKNEDGSVCYIIGIRKDIRNKIGKQPGDRIAVTVKAGTDESVDSAAPREKKLWKCPKCGRTFKNRNQDHYCGEAPKTIEEYISRQPEQARDYLRRMNEVIKGRAARRSGKDFVEYADLLEEIQSHPVCGF